MQFKRPATDNESMRNLLFTILIVVSVMLALLLWSPPVSTGDHPVPVIVSAGALR